VIALLGLGVLHLGGALLLSWVTPLGFSAAIRSPSSAWVSLALLYALSLGLAGVPLLVMLAGAAWLARHEAPVQSKTPWLVLGLLGVAVLARPWVPTLWDEFVWLAKARFESLGFGASVAAALNPQEHLIPPGYPPLWPAAVGWLALGRDSLDAHVVAGSLVLLLSAGAALESVVLALGARRPSGVVLAVLLVSTPFLWVHLRSTYVDLPMGLLAVALLASLLVPSRLVVATVLAVVLVSVKDEGVAHVAAATVSALLVRRRREVVVPAAAGLVAVMTWRLLASSHGVVIVDHAFAAPAWGWVPVLGRLLLLHATDLFTWGVFWAVAVACLLQRPRLELQRALRVMLSASLGLLSAALLVGPERVRAFAENGTLLNRLLVQLWPAACVVVLLAMERGKAEPGPPGLDVPAFRLKDPAASWSPGRGGR